MTKELCLQQQCGRLYKKIVQQLTYFESSTTDEKKWIEWGFGITTKAWLSIQEMVEGYRFTDQREEISFYKTLKPRFVGLMDFFTLLYRSVLFQPEDTTGKKEYWKRELATCNNFLSKHSAFCSYYEQGNTAMDPVYFVQQNNQQALIFGINENKWHVITSYSYLLARVISVKKYHRYVVNKIANGTVGNSIYPDCYREAIGTSRQSPVFN
jgi:hypothetical protein